MPACTPGAASRTLERFDPVGGPGLDGNPPVTTMGVSIGVIVGLVCGIVGLFILLAFITAYCRWRRT